MTFAKYFHYHFQALRTAYARKRIAKAKIEKEITIDLKNKKNTIKQQ